MNFLNIIKILVLFGLSLSCTHNEDKRLAEFYIGIDTIEAPKWDYKVISYCKMRTSDSVRHGACTSYFDSGELCQINNFANGKLDGEYLSYYKNGRLHTKSTWVNGHKVGEKYNYYEDGSGLAELTRFDDKGCYLSLEFFNRQGKKISHPDSLLITHCPIQPRVRIGDSVWVEIYLPGASPDSVSGYAGTKGTPIPVSKYDSLKQHGYRLPSTSRTRVALQLLLTKPIPADKYAYYGILEYHYADKAKEPILVPFNVPFTAVY